MSDAGRRGIAPLFVDRTDAGRRLGLRLRHLGPDVVVVGLPRGGLPVAAEVARELHAPLDVVVVRKLGVPARPELAMGALGEDGARVVDASVVRAAGVTGEEFHEVEAREQAELERRIQRFRGDRPRVPLAGRTVVVVDDGVATGSTARAACLVVRARGAARVVLAVPVAPKGWERPFAGVADELVSLANPEPLLAIGIWYARFPQVSDAEAAACLARVPAPRARWIGGARAVHEEDVEVPVDGVRLGGVLAVPVDAHGVVVFAHGSGSSRHSPRNRDVAHVLTEGGLATLLFDLLTPAEAQERSVVFDVPLLARRLAAVTRWLRREPGVGGLPVGWFGASTGAGAALWAAAEPACPVAAVVSRGGRPDLAGERLPLVHAPTLLIVGGLDRLVLELNRQALASLRCEAGLTVIPGATHLFEEPGTLRAAAQEARAWFLRHLVGQPDQDRAAAGSGPGAGAGTGPPAPSVAPSVVVSSSR